MEDIKQNISENLIKLRKEKKLTQKDLALEFNYSDKAVSRWENADSLPDINMLLKICEFYGVEFEWLLHKHEEMPKHKKVVQNNIKIVIVSLIAMCCFALATIIFVYNTLIYHAVHWKVFVWAVPISLLLAWLCSTRWWSAKCSTILFSCFMWAIIASVFLQYLPAVNTWPLFLLGVPAQAIIMLVYFLRNDKKYEK